LAAEKREIARQKANERLKAAQSKINQAAVVHLQPTFTGATPVIKKKGEGEESPSKKTFTCPSCNRSSRFSTGKRVVMTCTTGCRTDYHTSCWTHALKCVLGGRKRKGEEGGKVEC
jgi:hypothetical protein